MCSADMFKSWVDVRETHLLVRVHLTSMVDLTRAEILQREHVISALPREEYGKDDGEGLGMDILWVYLRDHWMSCAWVRLLFSLRYIFAG
jgi:hypothetical protein